jgi:hypothetical protein
MLSNNNLIIVNFKKLVLKKSNTFDQKEIICRENNTYYNKIIKETLVKEPTLLVKI